MRRLTPLLLALLLLAGACANREAARTPAATATAAVTRSPTPPATPTIVPAPVQRVASTSDLDGLSIAMGADQYNVGDQGRYCYTVPGPGQITITNNGASGTSVILATRDDGAGDCRGGPIAGPGGKYCIVMLFSGAAGVGTAQDCYQVFDSAGAS